MALFLTIVTLGIILALGIAGGPVGILLALAIIILLTTPSNP